MNLKGELEAVEKKLLEKKEQIMLEVLKAFDAYAMREWSYESGDCLVSDMEDLRGKYNQTIATLEAVHTVINMKEI